MLGDIEMFADAALASVAEAQESTGAALDGAFESAMGAAWAIEESYDVMVGQFLGAADLLAMSQETAYVGLRGIIGGGDDDCDSAVPEWDRF